MSPLALYHSYCQNGKITLDAAQEQILVSLDKLYHEMLTKQDYLFLAKSSLFRSLGLRQVPVKGLYLWGAVGRGKTFLMDLFYQTIPFEQKTRLHFHRFMQFVHQALTKHQGEASPLKIIASEFASRSWVLCFDEFYVKDIADAMILAELFEHLFHQGVTLLATSNLAPEDLYHNGLQREKFLPTIALIHQHTQVVEIKGSEDYRLKHLAHSSLYHYPLDATSQEKMLRYFKELAPFESIENKMLTINDREISTLKWAQSVVWFSFDVLCKTARSTSDYIEIARCFKTVFISGVQALTEQMEDVALRFIALVDEFYERHVTLIISAEVPLANLYQGKRHEFEFKRTISRLTEMQTLAYMAKPHLP
ncbi:MAG: AFG1 family ATPase [Proteobacteria bacterium]|nr:AFG1 family ATPase [Pseudomonadota bacterium]